MIPKELLNPTVLRLKGNYRGYVLKYPFGVVAIPKTSSGKPLSDERVFPDIPAALRGLKLRRQDCVPTKQEPERRYRVVIARGAQTTRSEWLHTYTAAAIYVDRVEWAIRLKHGLLLPCDLRIEDSRTGVVERPRTMGPLGPVKDTVHAVPPGNDRPHYVIQLPEGAAAIWTGSDPREEFWSSPDFLLLQYGLDAWPNVAAAHDLPEYSIVRPDSDGLAIVAGGYHSLLHAGRVANWLLQESGTPCFVLDCKEPQGFDNTIMSGDMIRMTRDAIETFTASVEWSKITLTPRERCVAAVATFVDEIEAEPSAGAAN